MSTMKLFLDWMNVDKGAMEATYDPERISDEGRAIIERNKVQWGIHPDLSGHGMKRNRLPFGVKIAIEKARKSAPWLVADQPWEKRIRGARVMYDEGRYRCWYQVEFPDSYRAEQASLIAQEGRLADTGWGLCYAESADGTHWVKPQLGLFPFAGSTANNIASLWMMGWNCRDDSAPPEERYKGGIWDKVSPDPNRPDYGSYGAVSPDGLRWTRLPEPLSPQFHDGDNKICWDPIKKKYIGYWRGGLGGRAISYAETDDFRKWPKNIHGGHVIAHPGPLDHPSDDYYQTGFTFYPGDPAIKLIFCGVYHHNTAQVDARLGVTHNGQVINWVSYDPIVEVGKPGAWDGGQVYTGSDMVRLPDGSLALPYYATDHTHDEYYEPFYRGRPADGAGKVAWAIWDDGRIAGIEADDHGEFWTTPDVCTGGPIEINARTSKVGRVEVELWESQTWFVSKPIPGFTFAETIPFTGDALWTPLRWRGKVDLSELKGKRIQLRVRLGSAKIFGYRMGENHA